MLKKLLNDPAFFDIFGLITFSFISIVSVKSLVSGEPVSRIALFILLMIGIAGLIVDGRIVWRRFIKRKSD